MTFPEGNQVIRRQIYNLTSLTTEIVNHCKSSVHEALVTEKHFFLSKRKILIIFCKNVYTQMNDLEEETLKHYYQWHCQSDITKVRRLEDRKRPQG